MRTGLKRPRQLRQAIGGQQGAFVAFMHGQIRGQPMQINRSFYGLRRIVRDIAPAGPQSVR